MPARKISSLKISDAAHALGVSTKTLRRWEARGILVPQRTSGNQRLYTANQIDNFDKTQARKQAWKVEMASSELGPGQEPSSEQAPISVQASNEALGLIEARESKKTHKFEANRGQKVIIQGFLSVFLVTLGILILDKAGIFKGSRLASKEQAISGALIGYRTSVLAPYDKFSKFVGISQGNIAYQNTADQQLREAVLAAEDAKDFTFNVGVPGLFQDDVEIQGNLTAPNVVYNLTAGDNITITGDPQTPTISASNSTADLNIFSSVTDGTNSITASGNTDSLTLASGSNVSLSFDTTNKKVTISSSITDTTGGWTDDGTVVRLSTASDIVSLGSATGSARLSLEGAGSNRDLFTASQSGNLLAKLTNTGLFNLSATGFDAGFKLQNSTTLFSGTGAPNDSNGSNGDYYFRTDGTGNTSLYTKVSGSWVAAGGGSTTLQDAYDNGNTITTTTGRDIDVTLADTATDANFLVNIASGSTGSFQVQNAGTAVTTLDTTGVVTTGVVSADGTITANGTLDANGAVTLGDGGDAIAISGTTVGITSNSAGNDITLTSADDILFSDAQIGTPIPFSLADSSLNVALTQGIVDAINDVYDISTGATGSSGYFQLNNTVISPLNNYYDLAIGGNASSSAKFEIFGSTGNATSAGTFTFSGGNSIQTTKNQTLTLGGNTTGNIILSPLTNAGRVGINTTSPDTALEINDASGNNLRLTYNDSDGSAQDYTDFTLDSGGNLTIAPTTDGGTTPGTVTLTASTLATDQTTFTLFDTTATTINFGGAATTLDIGAASGTTDVKNSLNVTADLDIDGGDLTASTTTFNLLQNTVTTLSFAGAATSISIGNSSGTTTINNASTVISGNLDVNGTSNDIAGTLNLSGNTLASSGDLVLDATGGGVKVGTGTPSFVDLAGDDLYVTGDLEVAGTIYGSLSGGVNLGFTQGSVLFIDSTGAIAQDNSNFYWDDTNNKLGVGGTPTSKLDVSGAVTGKALVSFNETGDQNILTASQSGIAVFNIARVSGTAANGITVTGATTSNGPTIAATGSDTNIALSIDGKGTGALNLNNNGTGDILIGGGSGSTGCTITNSSGDLACAGDFAVNGGNITSSQATASLFNTTPTTVNIAAAADTVNLTGGSGSTGCTLDGTTGDLTCSGSINGGATGAVGYWQRNAGAVSPTNITDDVLVGGIATSSAKFQIFGGTGNATTAGNLVFSASPTIATTAKQDLTLGDTNTGLIDIYSGTKLRTAAFQLTTGASSGWVLTSDGSGNGSWTDTTGTGSFGAWTLTGTTVYPNLTTYDLLIGSDQVADDIAKLTVTGAKTGKALIVLNETGDQNILTASASGSTVFNLERDGSIALTSSDTTGDALGITSTTLTTGNVADFTATYVDATGGTDSAIDINLTNNPSTSANVLRGLDLSITDADDNANTLYGVYSSVDNSGNTSVGTHSVYGGYFNATSTTAGTKTAIGLYANATGGDNNYAGIFENGYVGIGTATPTYPLEVSGPSGNPGATPARITRNTQDTTSNRTILELRHKTTGDMADDFGALLAFIVNDSAGVDNTLGYISYNRNGADNSGDFRVFTNNAGSTTEKLRILPGGSVGIGTTAPDRALEINQATGGNLRLTYNDSNGSAQDYTDFTLDSGGNLTIAPTTDAGVTPGTVTLTASTLATDQTTFTLFDTTATTINFGGAATTLDIGAASGTTDVKNSLNVTADLDIDGGDLTASTASFNLLNATVTTLSFAGAATP